MDGPVEYRSAPSSPVLPELQDRAGPAWWPPQGPNREPPAGKGLVVGSTIHWRISLDASWLSSRPPARSELFLEPTEQGPVPSHWGFRHLRLHDTPDDVHQGDEDPQVPGISLGCCQVAQLHGDMGQLCPSFAQLLHRTIIATAVRLHVRRISQEACRT